VIDIDGEPWFPAKDVCDALGITNARSAVTNSCSKHQHMMLLKSNVANPDVSFPNRGMLCVSKSGLYKLLFVSRKPAALVFQDWVTDVVLPSIMKKGGYIMGEEKMATGDMTRAELANAV
jgi:prophage antirepressor-like protein